jgi:hypothetical protein
MPRYSMRLHVTANGRQGWASMGLGGAGSLPPSSRTALTGLVAEAGRSPPAVASAWRHSMLR